MIQLLAYIGAGLDLALKLLTAESAAATILQNVRRVVTAGGPTPADWAALDTQTKADQDQLNTDAQATS